MSIPTKNLLIIFLFLIFTKVSTAEIIKASPKLSPIDVLKIQLNSLKKNDNPYPDAGIDQTWELAHPDNKKFTGPISKFKKMIYSEAYKILIDHLSHKIEILSETKEQYIFGVSIVTSGREIFFYEWQIAKVTYEGDLKDCWLTNGVSNPRIIGEEA